MPHLFNDITYLKNQLLSAQKLLSGWRDISPYLQSQNYEDIQEFAKITEETDIFLDTISRQDTEDSLAAQEPLGKEFEQILHDNMGSLMVGT